MLLGERQKSGRAITATTWRIGPLGRSAKTATARQQNNNERKGKEKRVKIDDTKNVVS
jgi:hypothetical protein